MDEEPNNLDYHCTKIGKRPYSELEALLLEAREYILYKAQRHDLNWRDGFDIISRIDGTP